MTSPFLGEFQGVAPLFLQGGLSAEMPLNVAGPRVASGVMATMFTQGPEANDLTLFMGEEIDANGAFPLYIQSPWATGSPGHTLEQALVPLAVFGTTHYNTNLTTTLSIDAPTIGSGIGTSTLFVQVDEPSADGSVLISGQVTVFMEGNDPAGVGVGRNEQTTLFIRVQEVHSSGMPIYLERPVADSIPLIIRSTIASGILPVSISGTLNATGSTTLHIVPPAIKSLNTNIAGYSE
jgi:hypothetical protein